jgi:hypothetical protein
MKGLIMQSERQSSNNSRTRARKIEAMQKLKAAYTQAKETGTLKSYTLTPNK